MKFDTRLYDKARKHIVIACVAAMAFIILGFAAMTFITIVKPLQDETSINSRENVRLRSDSSQRMSIREQAVSRLLITLVVMLCLGTVLSYVFALQILKPIKEAHEKQAAFTANAQHQIKTPVAIMRAEVENAQMKKQSFATTRILDSLLEELSEIERTTKALLGYTQPDVETASMSAKDFQEYAMSFSKKLGITIAFVKPLCALPLRPQDVRQLTQIYLDNIATHANVSRPQCTISATQNNRTFSLVFADNGNGSTNSESLLLQRGFTTKEHDAHSGLGLAIAEDIAKMYGGHVSLKSSASGFVTTLTV